MKLVQVVCVIGLVFVAWAWMENQKKPPVVVQEEKIEITEEPPETPQVVEAPKIEKEPEVAERREPDFFFLKERASEITDTGAVAIPAGTRVTKTGVGGAKILVTDGRVTVAVNPDILSETFVYVEPTPKIESKTITKQASIIQPNLALAHEKARADRAISEIQNKISSLENKKLNGHIGARGPVITRYKMELEKWRRYRLGLEYQR